MIKKATKELYEEVKRSEGGRTTPYVCPAGKMTIGYGHVISPNEKFDKITIPQANELFLKDMGIVEKQLTDVITVPITQGQFDAMCSLVFNIGIGAIKKSKAMKALNNKDYITASTEMFSRDKGFTKIKVDGVLKVSEGLVARRQREYEFWKNNPQILI